LALMAVMSAGAGGCGALLITGSTVPPPRSAVVKSAQKALSTGAIYARIAPSVVDVTSSLRYDGETADGTGFVINAAAALVLTNNHVIRDATEVTVTLTSTGRRYPARVVGTDAPADVALLQLQGTAGSSRPGLVAAPVGDSRTIATGAPVLAIGNQAGVGGTPAGAPGIISGLGQTIQANDASSGFTETLHNMLQTSARIAPGDSGGPLADAAGKVIGMDTAAGSGTSDRSGYAIPINDALAAARLIAAGQPAPGVTIGTHGFLGVVVARQGGDHPSRTIPRATAGSASASPRCAQTIAAATPPASTPSSRPGALVAGVLCGTGAAAAGLAAGDLITSANGQRISSPDALTAIMSGCRPGTLVTVTWISASGQEQARQVRLDIAPAVLPGGYTPTPRTPRLNGVLSIASGCAGGSRPWWRLLRLACLRPKLHACVGG
jgi:S1-C subfamily serine protease